MGKLNKFISFAKFPSKKFVISMIVCIFATTESATLPI